MNKSVLIIGSSISGIQAAIDLAEAGNRVHLVEASPFLGKHGSMAMPRHVLNTRLLEIARHPNIHVWTNAHLNRLDGITGDFRVELNCQPRYVDLAKCTGCGNCIEVCPVTVYESPADTKPRKAIFIDGQPGCAAIEKRGVAPCRSACPTDQRAEGYIALIRQRRYADAYWAIRREHPFPSVCGRVCNHACENACSRGQVDQPVNIMALKRFAADWAYAHRTELPNMRDKSLIGTPFIHHPKPSGKKVAIIGAGPAGLTAGLDLVRLGHKAVVFDSLPVAGGMMRVGIPPHRLPYDRLDWEVQQILDEGVELHLNTRIDDIPGLFEKGYQVVVIATGAHVATRLNIPGADHPDNILSLELLKKACLDSSLDLSGREIVVLGAGDVALDAARSAIRLGQPKVSIVCRGMRASFNELHEAVSEGVKILNSRVFKEIIVLDNKITGVLCLHAEVGEIVGGQRQVKEIPGTEHIIPCDMVVWALGQRPDFTFLPENVSIATNYPVGLWADEEMMTTLPGVFTAGDIRRGTTFFVVDAIAEGHHVARCVDRFLRGDKGVKEPYLAPPASLSNNEIEAKFCSGEASRHERVPIRTLPPDERLNNFNEVDLTLSEEEALVEAERCLRCGVCSECLECVQICKTGAVDHEQKVSLTELVVGAIIDTCDSTKCLNPPPEGSGIYHASPEDALLGSAVAAQVMFTLCSGRLEIDTLHSQPGVLSPVLDSSPIRVGVFICQCGDSISRIVDTQAVADKAATLPGVMHTQVLPFSCTPEAAQTINTAIESFQLNRMVLAACPCCSVDQVCYSCTFQRLRCKNNLGLFTHSELRSTARQVRFVCVNIREQCAWVHTNDPKAATAKASALIAASVARSMTAPPWPMDAPQIKRSVLILGSGEAGRTCQAILKGQGIATQWYQGNPSHIQRHNGQFHVTPGNGSSDIYQTSVLVLAPCNSEGAEQLVAAFGQLEHRPRSRQTWGGVETHRPGVYLCDPIEDPTTAGAAAAARAAAWLGHVASRLPIASVVDPARCRACNTCAEICEFGAPGLVEIEGRRASWIDPTICTGCGVCAVHCSSGAITAGYSTDAQIDAMLAALLECNVAIRGDKVNGNP